MFVMKGILFGMASSTVCYLMFLANVGLGNLRTHDPSDETEDERVQTATKWPHTYIPDAGALWYSTKQKFGSTKATKPLHTKALLCGRGMHTCVRWDPEKKRSWILQIVHGQWSYQNSD